MQYLIDDICLRRQTDPDWLEVVLERFPLFVADHAANERKAAATAMDFVVRYPDRPSLVSLAARIAEEEISHFRAVFQRMVRYGMPLLPDEKDPYVRTLRSEVRSSGDERLLDRLLVCSLVEARGLERFYLLAKGHPEEDWRVFYEKLAKSEKGHAVGFCHEAMKFFPEREVHRRLDELLDVEAEACHRTPLTGRFH